MQDEYVFGPTSPARISAQDNLVLKPPETQVCHTDPWRDDLLDRGDAAGELTKLLRNERSISISLSGAWGTGKTFFLRRWMKDLQRAGAKTAYVNAWESDFSHDPVIPITSSVAEAMQESRFRKATRALRQEVIDFLIINTESLLEKRIGIRLPILQKLRNKNRQKLDPYRARQAALKKLRETLETLARETWKDADHPLVIIIDELDRCRPDYAVELLERVKHVLRVEGVVFVFGVNRQALGEPIGHRFGISDTDGYLQKFFDVDVPLPRRVRISHFVGQKARWEQRLYALQQEHLQYVDSKGTQSYNPTAKAVSQAVDKIVGHLATLADAVALTPREAEHCLSLAAMALNKMDRDLIPYAEFAAPMILLKVRNQRMYEKYVGRQTQAGEVLDCLDTPRVRTTQDVTGHTRRTEILLYLADSRDGETPALAELKALRDGDPITRAELISRRTAGSGDKGHIQELIKGIENEPVIKDIFTGGQPTSAQKWATARDVVSGLLDLSPRLETAGEGEETG